MLKRIISFLGFCAYIAGAVGGFGTALYHGATFAAIAVIILAGMAFPLFKKCLVTIWN